MVIGSLIKTIHAGYKFYQRTNKIFGKSDPGLRAIDKYAPPHFRRTTRGLYKIGTAALGGKGTYDIYMMTASDSPGNNVVFPPQIPRKPFTTRKPYQTRSRFSVQYNRRYRIKCKPGDVDRYPRTRFPRNR